MKAFEDATKKGPSLLDICDHEKERQDCDVCKKRNDGVTAHHLAALEAALADINENPTPRGPASRKKW